MPAKTPKPRTMRVWVVMEIGVDGKTLWPNGAHKTRREATFDAKWCAEFYSSRYVALPFTGQMPKGKVRR